MKYTIFGGGPSGLYSAWRLLESGTITQNDSLEIIEWGDYDYLGDGSSGTRQPAGRICSHHYNNDIQQSYIEIGGMRYIDWDPVKKEGHQLVTTTINLLGLDGERTLFQTTDNPLLFIRGDQMYQNDISASSPVPYSTITDVNDDGNIVPANTAAADALIGTISNSIVGDAASTRVEQCNFYANGTLPANFDSEVYAPGTLASNIGYWNIIYDQAFNEGYQYAADANGYSSNVINWNAANAAVYNGEFAPGGTFKTLRTGFSSIFVEMYKKCVQLADASGLNFTVTKNTRLHSIWDQNGTTQYHTATAANPNQPDGAAQSSDVVFLALPPHAIKTVALATRYLAPESGRTNFLNHNDVANYLESVIEQPSYKVAMFFDRPWWTEDAGDMPYPPQVDPENGVFGPTITDLPVRQVYYFGDNSKAGNGQVYGLLASYDDMRFTRFWEEMEWSVSEQHITPPSEDLQPMIGGGEATPAMIKMLRLQLARVHYGNDQTDMTVIPEPLETVFMNWGHNPFGAGYHAWASHYNICNVMQDIRTPAVMAGTTNNRVFITGSAFSNDQAWIEGAFCTAESVLTEYLGVSTIATDPDEYPLICSNCAVVPQTESQQVEERELGEVE